MWGPGRAGSNARPGRGGPYACGTTAPRATGPGPTKSGKSVNPPLIAVLNGPNLNLLGTRQPEIYGAATLDDVEALCAETAEALGLAIDFRQTNAEGELVTWVQECRGRAAAIVINPAAYSHTSIALMDALKAVDLPVVEVHISNIHRREEFRHHSYVSKAATGVIAGLGIQGYALALRAVAELLAQEGEP
jgi:3-dehydroquinate dehydratase-2